MFTGIIEELGTVLTWDRSGDSARLTVRAPLAASDAGHTAWELEQVKPAFRVIQVR